MKASQVFEHRSLDDEMIKRFERVIDTKFSELFSRTPYRYRISDADARNIAGKGQSSFKSFGGKMQARTTKSGGYREMFTLVMNYYENMKILDKSSRKSHALELFYVFHAEAKGSFRRYINVMKEFLQDFQDTGKGDYSFRIVNYIWSGLGEHVNGRPYHKYSRHFYNESKGGDI